MAWYNASWTYRVKITIQNGKVDADLTNFPVYVNLANLPAGFHTNVNQTDARDIRVTRADGTTECAREVVSYVAASDTGELHFLADALANATDTEFYIYYGNAAATEPAANATYGSQNVWDSNYKAVWHLKNASSTTIADSTSNANTANKAASDSPTEEDSKIGKGQLYDGLNDELTTTNQFTNPQIYTISAWFKTSSASGKKIIGFDSIQTGETAGSYDRMLYMGTDGKIKHGVYDGAIKLNTSTNTLYDNAWHHAVGTLASGGNLSLFIDGSIQGSPLATGGGEVYNGYWRVGAYKLQYWTYGSDGYFPGSLDEIRISNIARSSTWISTEYNNQNSPATFYTAGGEETATSIKTINGLAKASVKTVNGLAIASVKTINGLT